MYKYHVDGTHPENGEIFVFGSNLSGIHGAGAARAAMDLYGAKFGVGSGFTGDSYAIPTKSRGIARTLNLDEIKPFIDAFKRAATNVRGMDGNPLQYFLTRVGCGLAGYQDSQIAPLFKGSPANCNFPEQWKPYIEDHLIADPALISVLEDCMREEDSLNKPYIVHRNYF